MNDEQLEGALLEFKSQHKELLSLLDVIKKKLNDLNTQLVDLEDTQVKATQLKNKLEDSISRLEMILK